MHQHKNNPDLGIDHFLKIGFNATCFGAGMAWHREVTDHFGLMKPGARNWDVIFPFRGLLLNGNAYLSEPLLDWRHHDENTSLALQLDRATSDLDRMLIRERDLLNRAANMDIMLEEAQEHFMNKGKDSNRGAILGVLLMKVHNLIAQWRVIRHELTRAKVGFH